MQVTPNAFTSIKQLHDLLIPKLFGKLLEGNPLRISCAQEAGEALDGASDPFDIASPEGKAKVVEFNPEKTTQLAQVLDRPPRGSRAELRVSRVYLRASLDQQANHGAVPAECRSVQRGPSRFVALIDKTGTGVKDDSHFLKVVRFDSFN
jgi:hypothetical protein